MTSLRTALARIRGYFASARTSDEVSEELNSHLDMAIAENIRRGMRPELARREALLASGGMTAATEAVRAQRGLPWLDHVTADVRYAIRSLSHSPAFTAIVVLTLALGIGANTAIFSVVRGVLLKPLPQRDGDRLVYLRQSNDAAGGGSLAFSVPETRDLREGAKSLGNLAEYSPWGVTLRRENSTVRLNVLLVSGNFFDVMGLKPVLGRVTRPSDDGPGVPPVMVLTHEYWNKEFGGDSSIVGKQVRIDAQSATVIGVLEPAPFYPTQADALLNMVISPHHTSALMIQGRTHRMTEIVARLAPGATLQQARAEVQAVDARMQRDYRESYDPGSHFRVAVIPYKEVLGETARTTLWLLMAAAVFVMIIAAANVVNLTLMRGVRREQELVVRAALGAGVLRLRRLLLAENLVLAALGALLGLVFAMAGLRVLIALAQRYSPRASEIRLDLVVLAFMFVLSVAVALLLSFVATLPKEGAFAAWIAAGTRRTSGSVRRQRLQRALVIAQIAVSVVLLAGAGLLTRTMIRLSEVSTGLKTEQVLSMRVPLVNYGALDSTTDAVAKQQYERMRDDLASLPGVIGVGLGSTMPLEGDGLAFDLKVESRPLAPGEAVPRAALRTANPQYFDAAGIPLVSGRAFTDADRMGTDKVVIVNRTLAQTYFPNESPIGKRVAWTGDVLRFTPFTNDWRTIVGVSGNTQDGGMDAKPVPVMYMPFAQEFAISGTIVVRTDSNPARLVSLATKHVHAIAPDAPIQNVKTVAQIKDESVAPRRLNAELISLFGALAVVVAAVGIAGVLAFSVSARTNEIGIRMSLGADRGRVQRMILGEGGVLLGVGLGVGVAVAFFVARVIRGLLFGVAPHDPTTFVTVAAMMTAIGVIACWFPADRASRIDPAIAMRS